MTWNRPGGLAPTIRRGLGYDLAGQLTSTATSGGAFAGSSTWAYDAAGNRTNQTQAGLVTGYVANALNQLTQTQPAQLQVKGLVSQAAAVQVNGLPATVAPDNSFAAQVPAPAGSQVITVTAQAGAAHSSQHFKVQNGQTLTYDLDGNLTSDGIHQYDWDAANRLIRISDLHPSMGSPAHVSEFTYDGLWRRVEIKEKQGLQTVADRKFVWAGAEIKEERDQSNNVVKRFYPLGVQVVSGPSAGDYSYLWDHLGNITGVLDGSGASVAVYSYDMWGNRTKITGIFDADFGFADYFEHSQSGLALTHFRAYSPSMGRWISRDPINENGGINLYGYVKNNPVSQVDSTGLDGGAIVGGIIGGISAGMGAASRCGVTPWQIIGATAVGAFAGAAAGAIDPTGLGALAMSGAIAAAANAAGQAIVSGPSNVNMTQVGMAGVAGVLGGGVAALGATPAIGALGAGAVTLPGDALGNMMGGRGCGCGK